MGFELLFFVAKEDFMEKFTKEMVEKYASDLLIGLTDEEVEMVLEEFSRIDEDINQINVIKNIERVEPMTHTLDDFVYTLREDEEEASIPIEDLLFNCKEYEGREVVVPRMVRENEIHE